MKLLLQREGIAVDSLTIYDYFFRLDEIMSEKKQKKY